MDIKDISLEEALEHMSKYTGRMKPGREEELMKRLKKKKLKKAVVHFPGLNITIDISYNKTYPLTVNLGISEKDAFIGQRSYTETYHQTR